MKETILAAAGRGGGDISWPYVAVYVAAVVIIAVILCFIIWAGGRD